MIVRRALAVFFAASLFAPCLAASPAFAQPATNWIPTWYAGPEPVGLDAGKTAEIHDLTLRQIVRISAGGTSIRLRLSNAYGADPLRLDDIRVARRTTGSAIDPASNAAVTFNGHGGVTIAPGAYVLSDPIPMAVKDDSDLAVSIYVNGTTPLTTVHDIQRGALYAVSGNQTQAATLPDAKPDLGLGNAFPWLAEVETGGSTATGAIATFGDSITDGYGITPDKGGTWPDLLSGRMHAAGIHLSVINTGISGNRLLHHGQWARFGDGALSRFDRDVLAQPNVGAVIILIGINDLGHAGGPGSPGYVSADDLIDGLSQLAERAHERGLKVYGATLTPFKDTVFKDYYSDEKEGRRQAINAWIRSTKAFDAVIDFDKTTEDPAAPGHMLPMFDLGDHLHPNDAGDIAMANAIPLALFASPAPTRPARKKR
jgi:lysophospholipase L1-like esterase